MQLPREDVVERMHEMACKISTTFCKADTPAIVTRSVKYMKTYGNLPCSHQAEGSKPTAASSLNVVVDGFSDRLS